MAAILSSRDVQCRVGRHLSHRNLRDPTPKQPGLQLIDCRETITVSCQSISFVEQVFGSFVSEKGTAFGIHNDDALRQLIEPRDGPLSSEPIKFELSVNQGGAVDVRRK